MTSAFRILYWIFFAALALTGFGFAVNEGMTLSGYPLLLHVGLTPLFTLLFLYWIMQKGLPTSSPVNPIDSLFTILLSFLLLTLIVSSLINFYPWLRPEEQEQTLIFHRIAAFLFTAGILLNALVSVIKKRIVS